MLLLVGGYPPTRHSPGEVGIPRETHWQRTFLEGGSHERSGSDES